MKAMLKRLIYIAAACLVLFLLGVSAQMGQPGTIAKSNSPETNQAPFERVRNVIFYAANDRH